MTQLTNLLAKLRGQSKALAGPVGVIAEGVSFGIFHGNALAIATAVVGIATYLGIYHAPYTSTTPTN